MNKLIYKLFLKFKLAALKYLVQAPPPYDATYQKSTDKYYRDVKSEIKKIKRKLVIYK